MPDRCAVFIDGGYIKKVLMRFGKPRVSYRALSERLCGGKERLRTYYYDCAPYVSAPPEPEERERAESFDRFKRTIEQEPRFQVRLGRLQKIWTPTGDKFTQKMVDILLTCDLLKLALEHQISQAVLIAGDNDFVPAIQIAKDAGTVVQLYYSNDPNPHDELLSACDERFPITQELLDDVRLY
jgi:uncharacterized LabA/DUF88 family protein